MYTITHYKKQEFNLRKTTVQVLIFIACLKKKEAIRVSQSMAKRWYQCLWQVLSPVLEDDVDVVQVDEIEIPQMVPCFAYTLHQ